MSFFRYGIQSGDAYSSFEITNVLKSCRITGLRVLKLLSIHAVNFFASLQMFVMCFSHERSSDTVTPKSLISVEPLRVFSVSSL